MSPAHTILICLAHPDDEILGPGGTTAHYAQQGVQVVLVCATRGEAGEISDPALAKPDTLGLVREQELICAAEALGIDQVIFLDYRDSGMAGTEENEHPDAFVNAPAEDVVPRLVGIIREVKPEILLTYEPFGGYGHPDHIAIHKHTVAAFDAAGQADQFPEQGAAWQPGRLYYPIIPVFFFEKLYERIAAAGGDVSSFSLDEQRKKGWPDDKIHVFMDVNSTIDYKFAAWNCHRTQFGPNSRFRRLPEAEMRSLLRREWFALARPEPPPGLHMTDLFAELP